MHTVPLPTKGNAIENKHFGRHAACALLIASSVLAMASTATAGPESISTDQPGFAESSVVVDRGRFQIETSIAGERTRRHGVSDRTLAMPTLLRYGFIDSLELRLETDGWRTSTTRSDSISNTVHGFGDVALGTKWHVSDAQGTWPSIGVLTHVDFDTGSPQVRGNGARPSVRVALDWDLPDALSLSVMPGLIWDKKATGERFASALLGISLGRSISDRLAVFTEVALPQITQAKNGGSTLTVGAGISYLLTNDIQVDTAIARGLKDNTPDLSWTVGLSTRF